MTTLLRTIFRTLPRVLRIVPFDRAAARRLPKQAGTYWVGRLGRRAQTIGAAGSNVRGRILQLLGGRSDHTAGKRIADAIARGRLNPKRMWIVVWPAATRSAAFAREARWKAVKVSV